MSVLGFFKGVRDVVSESYFEAAERLGEFVGIGEERAVANMRPFQFRPTLQAVEATGEVVRQPVASNMLNNNVLIAVGIFAVLIVFLVVYKK